MSAKLSASNAVAEIAAASPGPQVGAFFDLDGTLVAGFTATAHAGDRIRRRQARIGEVLGVAEAMMRYRFGRMEFERLVVRGAGYLRGESLADLEAVGKPAAAACGGVSPARRAGAASDRSGRPHAGQVIAPTGRTRRAALMMDGG
jgi:hypothetical protein